MAIRYIEIHEQMDQWGEEPEKWEGKMNKPFSSCMNSRYMVALTTQKMGNRERVETEEIVHESTKREKRQQRGNFFATQSSREDVMRGRRKRLLY